MDHKPFLFCLLLVGGPGIIDAQRASVVLTQVATYRPECRPRQIAGTPEMFVVVCDSGRILAVDDSRVRPINPPLDDERTFAGVNGNDPEFLTTQGHLIWHDSSQGEWLKKRVGPVPLIIDSAVRTSAGWYVFGKSAGGRRQVYHVRISEPARLLGDIEEWVGPSDVLASPFGDEVLVTSITTPPRRGIISNSRDSTWTDLGTLSAVELKRGKWISLHLIRIGSWFAQVLADITGGRWLLTLSTGDGQLVSCRLITAPVGFAPVDNTSSGRVLMVRTLDQSEIVLYEWEASTTSPTGGGQC